MKHILLIIIRLYQLTLSRDHGLWKYRYPYGHCPFYPSCSQYAHDAIKQKGSFKGVWLALRRVIRCRPGVMPAVDKVPQI